VIDDDQAQGPGTVGFGHRQVFVVNDAGKGQIEVPHSCANRHRPSAESESPRFLKGRLQGFRQRRGRVGPVDEQELRMIPITLR
jgi:hypothetical protein